MTLAAFLRAAALDARGVLRWRDMLVTDRRRRGRVSAAALLLQHAHDQGIHAGSVAGDEVYGGLDLRRSIRERGTGYVLAVRSNHTVTLSPAAASPGRTPPPSVGCG